MGGIEFGQEGVGGLGQGGEERGEGRRWPTGQEAAFPLWAGTQETQP